MPPTAAAEDLTEALNVVEQNVSTNSIMVFSKSYCPFCNKVKNLFKEKGLAYKALELDLMGQLGVNIQATLLQKTGQKTVPSVFLDGNHIGGCDDTLRAGQNGLFSKRSASTGGADNAGDKYDYNVIVTLLSTLL